MRAATITLLILLTTTATQAGTYSGGNGTEADPYQIATVPDWQELMDDPNDGDDHFILIADLNMTGVPLTPIGDTTEAFTGTFNGMGHIITDANISQPESDYVGLFGRVFIGGRIENLGCRSITVTGNDCVGALAGSNYGTITACYVDATVSGNERVGGLVGSNYGGMIDSCYAVGDVTGTLNAGGLVGRNAGGMITSSYATAAVGDGLIGDGGLVDSGGAQIESCFWDIQASGQSGSSGGKGLTTEQMKMRSIFQNAGWANGKWGIDDRQDYPRLDWEDTGAPPIPPAGPVPLAGQGTQAEPFLVSTEQDFALLSWRPEVLDKHIRLTADLDLNGIAIHPIGDLGPFTGAFDGNGHTIRRATISLPESSCVGLFAAIDPNGSIEGLHVLDVNIHGRASVGGLAGRNYHGSLTSCSLTGRISGDSAVGGMVGSWDDGKITLCDTSVVVDGHRGVGGLVGSLLFGDIISCDSDAKVDGFSDVGGLVGWAQDGAILNCNTSGQVSGDSDVGGLVGRRSYSDIASSYSSATVDGHVCIGGLIGSMNDGTISDCKATGSVSGHRLAGGLLGYGSASLLNCSATGNVTSLDGPSVGGLVGFYRDGTITSCRATGDVAAKNFRTGGLLGDNYKGTIISSYATGNVSSVLGAAGLLGTNDYGTVSECYATGDVNVPDGEGGGLVNWNNEGVISSCYATGDVRGRTAAGGLVNRNFFGTISSCYATGDAECSLSSASGLVTWNNDGKVIHCYATGRPSGAEDRVGGLCRTASTGEQYEDSGNIWDTDTSHTLASAMGTARTTAQMQTLSTFTDLGWDFTDTWTICEGTNYPRLQWQIQPADYLCPDGVALEDLEYLTTRWLADCTSPDNCEGADLTGDGRVDLADYAILSDQWLNR